MFISQAFAQAAGSAGGGMDGLQQFLPLVLIFVVFYFLLLRPQQKKLKAHKELIAQVRRGDRIVTQGGMFGTISKVIDDAVVLVEFADNIKIKVARNAIAEVLAKTEPVTKDKDAKDKDEAGDTAAPAAEGEAAPAEQKSGTLLGKLLGKK